MKLAQKQAVAGSHWALGRGQALFPYAAGAGLPLVPAAPPQRRLLAPL